MCPVLTSSAVHLIGGSTACEGVPSDNHSVLTMSVDRHKPAGEWLADVLPDTPARTGAQNVLECPVTCGGREKRPTPGVECLCLMLKKSSGCLFLHSYSPDQV